MLVVQCAIIGVGGGLTGYVAALVLSRAVAVMPGFGFVGALEISPMLFALGIMAAVLTATVGGLIPAFGPVRGNIADQIRES
jgi:hypothetical protein